MRMGCGRRVTSLPSQWTTLTIGTTLPAVASIRLSRTSITFKLPLRTLNETTETCPLGTETRKEYGDQSLPRTTCRTQDASMVKSNRHFNEDATTCDLLGEYHQYSKGSSLIPGTCPRGFDFRPHSQSQNPPIHLAPNDLGSGFNSIYPYRTNIDRADCRQHINNRNYHLRPEFKYRASSMSERNPAGSKLNTKQSEIDRPTGTIRLFLLNRFSAVNHTTIVRCRRRCRCIWVLPKEHWRINQSGIQ